MGATNFTVVRWSEGKYRENMDDAYHREVEDSRYEYGSDAYNGTISTTSGVHQIVCSPMTSEGALLFGGWASWNGPERYRSEKWGSALAIPVVSADAMKFSKQVMRPTLNSVRQFHRSKDYYGTPPDLEGIEIRAWDVTEFVLSRLAAGTDIHRLHSIDVEIKGKYQVKTVRGQGKGKTVYQVIDGNRVVISEATRSAAEKKAKDYLLKGQCWSGSLRIRAVKEYEGMTSGDTAVMSRVLVDADIKVTVTYADAKTRVPSESKKGWVFYGTAAE